MSKTQNIVIEQHNKKDKFSIILEMLDELIENNKLTIKWIRNA